MNIIEVIFIGVGLAMDALAVSICKGLAIKKVNYKNTIIIAGYFGFFQMLMPLLGYFLGSSFQHIIYKIDHWIAFALLSGIGLNMIKECFSKDLEDDNKNENIDVKTMLVLAIATSIDALAVGITFGFLRVNILASVSLIGIITFILCSIGVKLGNKFGNKFQNKAELFGGIILILIGIKILFEHLYTTV